MIYHAEVVYRDGEMVGDIRAGSYGHTLGGAVGLSMIQRGDGAKVCLARMIHGAIVVCLLGRRGRGEY